MPATLKPQSHVYKCNQRRNLDQWADDGSESSTGIYAENSNCYGNRKLKIVTRRGKRECRRF